MPVSAGGLLGTAATGAAAMTPLGWAALGAQLLPSAISGFKSLVTAQQRKAAEAALEKEVAAQKPNQSILDYYNKAYNQYSPNAYQSSEYNAQMRNVLGNQAAGISALQDRRSALAGIPSITQATNIAAQRAGAGAEAAQRANLGILGSAAGMKAGEENRIRQMKLNLMAQKAGQLAQTGNIQGTSALKGLENASILAYQMSGMGNKYGSNYGYTYDPVTGKKIQ
jgi:hypothetical protein